MGTIPFMKNKIKWLPEPEEHNYPAAESYLNLILDNSVVKELIEILKSEKVVEFKSKDIFRASRLSLLGVSNSHVKKNFKKIDKGEELSPILLVRDTSNRSVIIADGYHRMCAVYSKDEDALIPCKIVTITDKVKTFLPNGKRTQVNTSNEKN